MFVPAKHTGKVLVILCCLLSLLVASGALAQGVMVAPSRILLDGSTRAATVFLANRSDEATTYRISLVFFRMTENGSLDRADSTASEAENSATEVLRYSPHRVVIPAGGSQTVRLLVRRPAGRNVDDQEFRAHLSVCSVPTAPQLQEVEEVIPDIPEGSFAASMVASVETTVPIIVRFGNPEAQLAVSAASILPQGPEGRPAVTFSLDRTGQRSLYGTLTVTHVDPQGRETQLYFGRGIAVYTPNPRRVFTITPQDTALDLLAGYVVVDYQETADGGGDLQARAEIRPSQLSQR
jgi:P pilus assembly chaperone PapD